MLRADDERDAK